MRRAPRELPAPVPLLLALGLAAAAPCGTAAQTVVGRVTDAARGSGVAGATVVLLDADLRPVETAVTDATGRFVLRAEGPGDHLVGVDRPGWASQVSLPLRLRRGVHHEERIVVEPLPASSLGDAVRERAPHLSVREDHLVALCGPLFRPGRQGVLVGAVVDEDTGRTVPHSTAVAEWGRRHGGGPRWGSPAPVRLEIAVGETGVFVFCGLPADTEVSVRAVGGGATGASSSAAILAGRVTRVDLPLPVGGGGGPDVPRGEGSILGRVEDYATGEPVQAAEVTLAGGERRAVTDANGRFVMEGVPAGSHLLAVRHVAFPRQELMLPVRPGAGHDVRVRMVPDAIPLPPIHVTIRSTRWFRDMSGFTRRYAGGVGHFFPPEEIRARSPAALGDLLRSVPGVSVAAAPAGPGTRVRMRGRRCDPAVYVDRVLWGGDDPFTHLRAAELEAVEVYRGPTEVPSEFTRPGDGCGAVVVWTRKGLLASR